MFLRSKTGFVRSRLAFVIPSKSNSQLRLTLEFFWANILTKLSSVEEMRNRDGISGLFFGSLPNLEELVAAKATIQTNKDDEISTIQPMCCR